MLSVYKTKQNKKSRLFLTLEGKKIVQERKVLHILVVNNVYIIVMETLNIDSTKVTVQSKWGYMCMWRGES